MGVLAWAGAIALLRAPTPPAIEAWDDGEPDDDPADASGAET